MANSARGAAFLDEAAAHAKAKGPRFPRVWLDDATAAIDANYLLKGVIERGRLCVIYGPAGDGKTFFTADLAGHIAAGISWRGRRVRSGLVVYVAAEAGVSILRRFFAWREHRMGEAREGRIPLAIITRGVNLLNTVEVEALLAELRAIVDEIGLPLALVIFDTLSRSIPGGDENRSEDMTRVIEACDAIRDELGAATAIVHHSGKNSAKGARGHSSLFGAADTVICVEKRVASVEKSRDGIQGEQFAFDLEAVNLGEDQDGDAVTTCVVRHVQDPTRRQRAEPTGKNQRVVWRVLRDLLAERGEGLSATSAIPAGVRGIRFELLAEHAAEKFPGRPGRRVRQAVSEAIVGLQAANLVGVHGEWIWTQ